MTALLSLGGFRRSKYVADLRDISNFIFKNSDALAWVLNASGAAEYVAILDGLIEALTDTEAGLGEILQMLAELRHALVDLPIHASAATCPARPDLDAAIRWYGARLDDLLFSFKERHLSSANVAADAAD